MVNKKAVIIVTIITIILIATIVGYFILKLYISEDTVETDVTTKNNYSNNTNITQNNNVVKEDENANTNNNAKPDKDENTTNNETNSMANNTNNNSSNTEKIDTNKPSSNMTSDKLENGEDVAISLAKKKYNKDDKNVYYYVEEQLDHDVYVISVRNKSTTASIIQYEVNITTEEVTEY